MKKRNFILASLAVLALAVLLNPSAERHRAEIRQAVSERSKFERVIGLGHLSAFASRHSSLGVASYSTINGDIVTVGVFGMVFFVA